MIFFSPISELEQTQQWSLLGLRCGCGSRGDTRKFMQKLMVLIPDTLLKTTVVQPQESLIINKMFCYLLLLVSAGNYTYL